MGKSSRVSCKETKYKVEIFFLMNTQKLSVLLHAKIKILYLTEIILKLLQLLIYPSDVEIIFHVN